MSNILTVSQLEKTYVTESERLTVFKKLNLSVEEGSKTVIIGESGSGKSTLLNIIGSIDSATSGSVTAGPWNVTALKEKEQAERVLNRMLNNPTRGDEQIMRGKSNIRVKEVASKDCWWNYNCD